jgi:hypothetical protein
MGEALDKASPSVLDQALLKPLEEAAVVAMPLEGGKCTPAVVADTPKASPLILAVPDQLSNEGGAMSEYLVGARCYARYTNGCWYWGHITHVVLSGLLPTPIAFRPKGEPSLWARERSPVSSLGTWYFIPIIVLVSGSQRKSERDE